MSSGIQQINVNKWHNKTYFLNVIAAKTDKTSDKLNPEGSQTVRQKKSTGKVKRQCRLSRFVMDFIIKKFKSFDLAPMKLLLLNKNITVKCERFVFWSVLL